MDDCLIYSGGSAPTAEYACSILRQNGLEISTHPSSQVTHLLLDVPGFRDDGFLRSGEPPEPLLSTLPTDITICGGKLDQPCLQAYRTWDFLKDEAYLAQNAYITAECVLDVILPRFSGLLRGCPILVIGWGRIGKCLSRMLQAIGAEVTVAARNPKDRAMLRALGFGIAGTDISPSALSGFRILINTVPSPILSREQTTFCREDCLLVELASQPGLAGENIISARGLPGIHRPEASGELIARTLLDHMNKEELS